MVPNYLGMCRQEFDACSPEERIAEIERERQLILVERVFAKRREAKIRMGVPERIPKGT